jgi:hypothetical protein
MGKTMEPGEIEEFTRALEGLAAKAHALGMHFSREEIARRMAITAGCATKNGTALEG